MADEDLGLVACIARAQEQFGSLPKDENARIVSDKGSYAYDYISEGSLMARVREVLSPMGVAVFVSTINVERDRGAAWVTVEIKFAKGEERESVRGEGYGQDARDKAYNKALTSAVRTTLTKTFLQGGDIDPEQTVNERGSARQSPKLSEAQIRDLTRAAMDAKITTPDGALDPKLLCRIASYAGGRLVTRIDAIDVKTADKLVDRALTGFAANPTAGLAKVQATFAEQGWEWK
jgi:hypothetical protein